MYRLTEIVRLLNAATVSPDVTGWDDLAAAAAAAAIQFIGFSSANSAYNRTAAMLHVALHILQCISL